MTDTGSEWRVLVGDVREQLALIPEASVQCVVTSPPYWGLRDYGHVGQLGLELTPEAYVLSMVEVFRLVRQVLRDDGVLFLNLGDSYANDGKWGGETGGKQAYLPDADRTRVGREKRVTGLKPKDLVGIPWEVAFALRRDGWYLRQDIIWSKPNPMPESVRDRTTKAHEYIFLLTKSEPCRRASSSLNRSSPSPPDWTSRRRNWHTSEPRTQTSGLNSCCQTTPVARSMGACSGSAVSSAPLWARRSS